MELPVWAQVRTVSRNPLLTYNGHIAEETDLCCVKLLGLGLLLQHNPQSDCYNRDVINIIIKSNLLYKFYDSDRVAG